MMANLRAPPPHFNTNIRQNPSPSRVYTVRPVLCEQGGGPSVARGRERKHFNENYSVCACAVLLAQAELSTPAAIECHRFLITHAAAAKNIKRRPNREVHATVAQPCHSF